MIILDQLDMTDLIKIKKYNIDYSSIIQLNDNEFPNIKIIQWRQIGRAHV